MTEEMKQRWQQIIARLTVHIGKQMNLKEEEMDLMMMHLNTPRRIKRFSDWCEERTKDNRLMATPAQVLSAATRIGRDWDPLPDEAYKE